MPLRHDVREKERSLRLSRTLRLDGALQPLRSPTPTTHEQVKRKVEASPPKAWERPPAVFFPSVVLEVLWMDFDIGLGPEGFEHVWIEVDMGGLAKTTTTRPKKCKNATTFWERRLVTEASLLCDLRISVPISPESPEMAHLRAMLTSDTKEDACLLFTVFSRRPASRSESATFADSAFSPSMSRWSPTKQPSGPVYEVGQAAFSLHDLLANRHDALRRSLPIHAEGVLAPIGHLGVTVKALHAIRFVLADPEEEERKAAEEFEFLKRHAKRVGEPPPVTPPRSPFSALWRGSHQSSPTTTRTEASVGWEPGSIGTPDEDASEKSDGWAWVAEPEEPTTQGNLLMRAKVRRQTSRLSSEGAAVGTLKAKAVWLLEDKHQPHVQQSTEASPDANVVPHDWVPKSTFFISHARWPGGRPLFVSHAHVDAPDAARHSP